MTNFLNSLYILEISSQSDVGLVGDLFPFCRLLFSLVDHVLYFTEAFSFRRSHLLIVSLNVCATGVIFRKWSPAPMYSSVLPTFSFMRFSVAGFMLRSLNFAGKWMELENII